MPKVKVFEYVGQRSRSRSLGQNFLHDWKGPITSNVHVNYEAPLVQKREMYVKGQGHKVINLGVIWKGFIS